MDEEGNQVTAPIPGTAQRFFADQRMLQYIGKLTYNLNADHNLSVTVTGTPNVSGGDGRYAINDRTGNPEVVNAVGQYGALASSRWVNSLDVSAKWAGSFLAKRLLVDASVGYHDQARNVRASDGTSVVTGLFSLAGHHVLKAGVDLEQARFCATTPRSWRAMERER
ncbi:MAG: hypothetical protein M3Y59_01305 [Myxococcota bacterium]|nr:hypothetical protein [Myxococcota bacterium]